MGFLKQADNRRYGMVLADLENDYMKGDTNYPLDMPSAYMFLDEFKLDKSGRDSHERSSTHIAFVQGNSELECYTCGLAGYTKYNCPKCNKQTSKKPFDANRTSKPNPRFKPSGKKFQKNFAQMDGRKNRKKAEKPALGFVQLGEVLDDEQETVGHCFTTVGKVESIEELERSELEPSYSDQALIYEPSVNNMIGKKFTEYFTCQLAQDFVDYGLCKTNMKQFRVDTANLHKIISFAECLICGGRGFFGLTC